MADLDQERTRIREVYSGYQHAGLPGARWSLENPGNLAIAEERRRVLGELLARAGFLPLAPKRVLEIGCGGGAVLADLVRLGAEPGNLSGIDMLDDRVAEAVKRLPAADIRTGDARHLEAASGAFDLVVAFTVFSSILDGRIAGEIAAEMTRVLKPGGAAVIYDLRYGNPGNPNIRPIRNAEVKGWFPGFEGSSRTLTLLPPISRRLGRMTGALYPVVVSVPVLRSHCMRILVKPGATAGGRGR